MSDNLSRIEKLVQPDHWDQFVQFLRTGEADAAFLAYLDTNKDCQEAMNLALDAQSQVLQTAFRELEAAGSTPALPTPPARKWPSRMAAALALASAVLGVGLIYNGLVGEGRVRNLQQEVARREGEVSALGETVAKEQEKLRVAHLQLKEEADGKTAALASVSRLQSEASTLGKQLEKAAAAGEQQAKQLAEAMKQFRTLEKSLDEQRAKFTAIEKDYSQAKQDLEETRGQNTKLKADNTALVKQIATTPPVGWQSAAAWCVRLRNEPFPNRGVVMQGLIPDPALDKSGYARVLLADLDRKGPSEIRAMLDKVSPDGFWGRLAAAEAAAMNEARFGPMMDLLTETEKGLIEVSRGTSVPPLLAQRLAVREAAVRQYHLGTKGILDSLTIALARRQGAATQTAVALVLAEIGPDAASALPDLHESLKTASSAYDREAFSFSIHRIGGSKPRP